MRILQLGKAYPPVNLGGVEVVIQLLAEGLNKNGIHCDALGVNDKFEYANEQGKYGGEIFRTKLIAKKFSTLLSFQLIHKLKEIWRNYDIIHIHTPDPMAALAMLMIRPKGNVVLHWHSDILKQKFIYFFYKPLLNWLSNRADVIIATSPNYIEESYFLSKYKSKVSVVPIGIDVDITQTINNDLGRLYSKKKIIFSLGRLAYYKGFEYLVEAARYIDDDMVIVIAGEGEERGKLEQQIQQFGLENKVKLVGKVSEEDKNWYFSKAKTFVLSSVVKTEAYAIVQVEAMAYGLPIVSTRIKGSGVDWVNKDGVSGLTVEPRNPEKIAQAIMKLLGDEPLHKRISMQALQRYEQLFKQQSMIDQVVTLYAKLLKNG